MIPMLRVETTLSTSRRVKTRDKDLVKIKDNRAESSINQKMLKIMIHLVTGFKVPEVVSNNTNRNKVADKATNNIIRKANKTNLVEITVKDRICKAVTSSQECRINPNFCLTSKISSKSIRVNLRSSWWMSFKSMDQSWRLSLLDKEVGQEVSKPFFRVFNRSNNNKIVNSSRRKTTEETIDNINKSNMVNSKTHKPT